MRFSIRNRFLVLLLLLIFMPFLAYRFAIDLHRILLENQAIVQQQTVQNLSLILENRTDIWAQQIEQGKPTNLGHLNLDNSILWVVNRLGQTNYVVGDFSTHQPDIYEGVFVETGQLLVRTLAAVLPYSLPYPYPQNSQPERTLINKALIGQTMQQYRMNSSRDPVSLMSGTPLVVKGHIIGALILEQPMTTLYSENLSYFYKLIGIAALIFLIVVFGALWHTAALSNRIIRLDNDVKQTFNPHGRITDLDFPDRKTKGYHDELSDLRHHIYEMLEQLGAYERYLKQLPKTLRHELHNPLNRMSMALNLLENEVRHPQLNYINHALKQLKQIISLLSEASSIEGSLSAQEPEKFPVAMMFKHYFENTIALNPSHKFELEINVPDSSTVMGDGFMLEQLLDKLISNAMDFNDHKKPIQIRGYATSDSIHLSIMNSGPFLPEGMEKQIFEGMTSVRTMNSDDQTHLGLGLYIVKLITDFHQGEIHAHNINSIRYQGVEFNLQLPLCTD